MSSQIPTDEAFLNVMEKTGFYRNGNPTPGVTNAASLAATSSTSADKRAKYKAVIDENKIGAAAIYELSGSPCIYFKTLSDDNPSSDLLNELHKMAWNQGLAPLMWVITPTQIRIFNSYAKPSQKIPDSSGLLLPVFERTAEGLRELNHIAGRVQFESGHFWQSEAAKRIDRKERVDASLLEDLQYAEKTLLKIEVDAEQCVKSSVAHSLLGRSIFAAYLQDRNIVSPEFMLEHFSADNVADVLAKKATAYKFFHWIRDTFNGDLFPLAHKTADKQIVQEEQVVQDSHLQVIQNLLVGRGNPSGQGRLWRYEFDIIPIELISSIYEMFARSNNPDEAKKQSMHYTPFNLVDLVLSQVCPQLPAKAKIADLSCGSGVFLVEALRRLVARRVAEGENFSREMIRETLYKQIYGVDISLEAIQIAAFSLYLTALDLDENPQPPEALKFDPLIGCNLFAANAFDEKAEFNTREPFASKDFDAIVGNPPWKQEVQGSAGREYCKRQKHPVATSYLSQAFLWRSGDFSSDKTHIGLILHASPFFSHTEEAYKAKRNLLQTFKPTTLINFAELHQQKLFPKAVAPALVYIAKAQPVKSTDTFSYVAAEWSSTFKRHGIIEIGPENVKCLPVMLAANDPDALKVAAWGSPRDLALIKRLRDDPRSKPLGALVNYWKWTKPSVGLEITAKGRPLRPGLPTKYLPTETLPRYILDTSDIEERPTILKVRYQPKSANKFHGPLLLVTRGISNKGFYCAIAEDDLLYTRDYIGLPAIGINSPKRYFLNGILNSSLAEYFLFLTASVWGVERGTVEAVDLMRLPIPDPAQFLPNLLDNVETIERHIAGKGITDALKRQLDRAVFDLYGLSDTERILVEDTVSMAINRHMQRASSTAYGRPRADELEAYTAQCIGMMQPFFRALNTHTLKAEIFDVGTAPLAVVKFCIVPIANDQPNVKTVQSRELRTVLDDIASGLPHKIADRVFSRRDVRIYNGDDIFIIKPAQRRFWSRSAGLNDADLILAESLGVDNAAR